MSERACSEQRSVRTAQRQIAPQSLGHVTDHVRNFVSREFVLVERQQCLTLLPPLPHVRLLVRVADVNAGLERIVLLEEFATGVGIGGRKEVVEQRL